MYIERAYTDKGTFGKWYTNEGDFICYSLEKVWHNNTPQVSCIPEGEYILYDHLSPRFGNTYALMNLDLGVGIYPGAAHRNLILLHAANKPSELQGCIAPGMGLTHFGPEWGVSSSRNALGKIFQIAANDHTLEIVAAPPVIWNLPKET